MKWEKKRRWKTIQRNNPPCVRKWYTISRPDRGVQQEKGVKFSNFPASDRSATTSASRSCSFHTNTTFSVAHPPPTRPDTRFFPPLSCVFFIFFPQRRRRREEENKKIDLYNISPPLLEIIYFPSTRVFFFCFEERTRCGGFLVESLEK